MNLTWHERDFGDLTCAQLYQLLVLRQRVFVVEQTCAYLDADGADPACRHLWAEAEDGTVHACVRLVPPGLKFPEVSIGRVATSPESRGTGLGRELMRRAIAACAIGGIVPPIRIGAQAYLEKFYSELGFTKTSDLYDEDGIPHYEMLRA